VAYIITDEERQAFQALADDEEREQFIERVLAGPRPTPDTVENVIQGRALPAASPTPMRTSLSGIPGWKNGSRAHLTLPDGPPDEKETHPSGRNL